MFLWFVSKDFWTVSIDLQLQVVCRCYRTHKFLSWDILDKWQTQYAEGERSKIKQKFFFSLPHHQILLFIPTRQIYCNPKYKGQIMFHSVNTCRHWTQRPHFNTCPLPRSLSAVHFPFEPTGQWMAHCSTTDLSPEARENTLCARLIVHCSFLSCCVCGPPYGIVTIDF